MGNSPWRFGVWIPKDKDINLKFALSLLIVSIIYLLSIVLLGICFTSIADRIANFHEKNIVLFMIFYLIIISPITLLFYKQFKKYEKEFNERISEIEVEKNKRKKKKLLMKENGCTAPDFNKNDKLCKSCKGYKECLEKFTQH